MLIKFMRIILCLFIALTLFCSTSSAETESKTKDCFEIDSYIRYIPSRSVDAMSGKVEIIESDIEYSYELKAFDKLPLKFSLDTKYIGIEDTVAVELPSHLTGLTTDFEATLPFFNFNNTYLRIGISPSFYGDDWNFRTSNFRIPTRYFLIYQPNAKWTFLTGLGFYPDFENEVLSVLGFIYKPNDRLTFNIVPERPNITYLLNDRVSLFAEGGSSVNSEFEVTRNNLKNVVLRYKEIHIAGGLKFKLNKYIQSSIAVGGMFNRSLKYRDNQGKVNIKDGLYAEFRIEIKS